MYIPKNGFKKLLKMSSRNYYQTKRFDFVKCTKGTGKKYLYSFHPASLNNIAILVPEYLDFNVDSQNLLQ